MMLLPRIIPLLLLRDRGLVKTKRFARETYLGDPVNALRIFNAKEVDEVVILDITATAEGRFPDPEYLSDLASECFMPAAYGGGIKTLTQMESILRAGFEKVVLSSVAFEDPKLISAAARQFGGQSIVVCLDTRASIFHGQSVYTHRGKRRQPGTITDIARRMEDLGAGEIILQSIDRDGMMSGYDLPVIASVAQSIKIPVTAAGGAATAQDFRLAVCSAGASAVAAGSMFVFCGKSKGFLINVPAREEIVSLFQNAFSL